MIKTQNPKLQNIVGKTVKNVKVSDSHGETVIITFEGGTKLVFSTFDSFMEKHGDLYVSLNEKEL